MIYRNKKKLKGTGISVTESLTAMRINMLEKARAHFEQRVVTRWKDYVFR